jgi:hypothetical protein
MAHSPTLAKWGDYLATWDQQRQQIETLLRQDQDKMCDFLLAMQCRMGGGEYQQNVDLQVQAPVYREQTKGNPKQVAG